MLMFVAPVMMKREAGRRMGEGMRIDAGCRDLVPGDGAFLASLLDRERGFHGSGFADPSQPCGVEKSAKRPTGAGCARIASPG